MKVLIFWAQIVSLMTFAICCCSEQFYSLDKCYVRALSFQTDVNKLSVSIFLEFSKLFHCLKNTPRDRRRVGVQKWIVGSCEKSGKQRNDMSLDTTVLTSDHRWIHS